MVQLEVVRAVPRVVARLAVRHAAACVSAQTAQLAQKVRMVAAKELYLAQLLRGSVRASQLRQALQVALRAPDDLAAPLFWVRDELLHPSVEFQAREWNLCL